MAVDLDAVDRRIIELLCADGRMSIRAVAERAHISRAAALADTELDVVHLVGGGSRNELLCQWTADALGLPVVAGPVEATAIGNIVVQARAAGAVDDLAGARRLIAAAQEPRRYTPQGGRAAWDAAAARLGLD